MTTLREMIANFTPTDENLNSYANLEYLARALEIPDYMYIDNDESNTHLRQHWIECWQCTDTWVGISVWYMNDVLVAVQSQPYRKSDPEIEFISEDSAAAVKRYLETLIDRVQYPVPVVNLDQTLSEFWTAPSTRDDQGIFSQGIRTPWPRKRR